MSIAFIARLGEAETRLNDQALRIAELERQLSVLLGAKAASKPGPKPKVAKAA